MSRYVSILRGINVSGQKKIKMLDLAALYESLQLKNIQTYIQSGNVIFDSSSEDCAELCRKIEKRIKNTFGFDVPIMIRTKAELQKVISGNPFLRETDVEMAKLHVTFLETAPTKERFNAFEPPASADDRLVIKGRETFLYCPDGYGRTKFTNTLLEKKLAVRATTRTWKTINKLLQMADDV